MQPDPHNQLGVYAEAARAANPHLRAVVVGDEYLRAVEAPHTIGGKPVWHAQFCVKPDPNGWTTVSVTHGPVCFMTAQAALDAASLCRTQAVEKSG